MKKISALLLAVLLSLTMAGCGKKADKDQQSKPDTSSKDSVSAAADEPDNTASTDPDTGSEAEPESSNDEPAATPDTSEPKDQEPVEGPREEDMELPDGTFDFEKAIDNFWLYGEKIEVPFGIDSLSKNFVWGRMRQSYDENAQLTNETWATLYYKEVGTIDDMIASMFFADVLPDDIDGTNKWYFLSVEEHAKYNLYGVKPGMMLEDVKKIWGKPNDEDEGNVFYRSNTSDSYITIYTGSDKQIVKFICINLY